MVPKGLRVAAICATIVTVILLVVFVGRKLLRRRPSPLALASVSSDTVELSSSNELRINKSCEPSAINLATFERATLSITMYAILKATGNLNVAHIIGRGDFGTVYNATFPGGQGAAIKRLHGKYQCLCDRQFADEMETIGKVEHDNLVPLLGYYAVGGEHFLIYKHMRHGSLETWLRNQVNTSATIGWPDRLKICIGSARGLMFLHHDLIPRIIHRDIKSSNILLDECFQPRVSDFFLARIITGYETHVRTGFPGTLGYIPPEYTLTMKGTTKGDVYGFGVVMLEVLTGRPPVGQEMEEEGGGNLVGWVGWMIAHGREGELFDPCLPASGMWREQMVRVLAVARECTADEPWKRPTMGSVVKDLEMIQLTKHDEPDNLQGRVD